MKADSAENIAAVKQSIKTVMPKATVTTAEDLADQVSGSLSSASKLADRLGTWLAVAALVAAFAVASLLTVSSVSRRVREFGTLKALGWRSRRIVGQVLGESFVQGVVGGVLGVVIGVVGARLITWLSPSLEASVGPASGAAMGGPMGARRGPAAWAAPHAGARVGGGQHRDRRARRAGERRSSSLIAVGPRGRRRPAGRRLRRLARRAPAACRRPATSRLTLEEGMLYELDGRHETVRPEAARTSTRSPASTWAWQEGEFLAIQGSTGSGKTTLLQMLGALDRPSGGEVRFDGRDMATLGEGDLAALRSHSFGFVFQTFNLIPTLTAQENVETALVPWGVAGDERRSRAQAALARVGLAERARHLPFGALRAASSSAWASPAHLSASRA